jgi:hypothetical protein
LLRQKITPAIEKREINRAIRGSSSSILVQG